MANLKFYKMAAQPTGTTEKPLTAGAVWFDSTAHVIRIYDGANWTAYTGLIDAVVENEKLTITNYEGKTVSVDFSVYATDEALELLSGTVSTLSGTVAGHGQSIENLQGRMTTVEGKAATAEGQLAGLTEATVMTEIAKQVAAEAEIARAAEEALDGRVDTLETASEDYADRLDTLEGYFDGEGEGVAAIVAAAIAENNNTVVTPGLAAKADKTTYEAYVAANDAAVAAVKKTAEDEVARAQAAEALIDEKIGVPVGVEGVAAYSKDYTVGMDVKAAKDAAATAQQTIDNFLTGEGVDPNAIENLKEIVAYIAEHEDVAEGILGDLSDAKDAIAILNGDAETAGSVAKAVADAEARVNATIEENERVTSEALNDLNERVGAIEDLSAGDELDAIKDRLDTLEEEVNTNIPQDIADAQAAAESKAAELATAAQTAAEAKAAELIAAEVTRSNKYADDAVTVEKGRAELAEKANSDAIAALDAKVTEGLSWVTFE